MDYVKSVVTQEKMQVWMNIMIKYFTLPKSASSSQDARNNWNCYAPIQNIFHKNSYHTPEKIGLSESFYTGTKAPLQIIMATEHDSMLFQPEDDSGWWSCGTFTIVKVLENLLQLERNGKTKFLGNRAQSRLDTESWKVLKHHVVATDRTDDLLSVTSEPPTKSTFILEQFGLK